MKPIQHLTELRHDFAIEAGWLDVITTPVSEEDWKAGRLLHQTELLYGPSKVRCYEHYLLALRKIRPTPLMLYYMAVQQGESEPVAWIRSRRFPAQVERTAKVSGENQLFREMFSRVERAMGLIPGSRSPLRPWYRPDGVAVDASYAIVHDTQRGYVWVADFAKASELVSNQMETLEATVEALETRNSPLQKALDKRAT